MMETALRSRLLDDADVTAIVTERVHWSVRPQDDELPSLVLQVISDPRPQTYKGAVGMRQTRVQLDCYAADRAGAVALREAVIAAITPAGTFFGTKFQRAFIDTVRDLGAHSDTADFVHRDSIDALIWHT